MAVWKGLEPEPVFRYFEGLSAIPRGSGNTAAVADWCVDFARRRGLEWHRDKADNVILIKEASPGRETEEPVIIQGHLDMVCVKEPDCPLDMEREGLSLAVDGDWIYARGTSLGADDGIAVAMGLALLDGALASHPRLECVFTADEEIGMPGAAALDVGPLRGRRMLNLDSEREGILTVGCAGGVTALCRLPVTRTKLPDGQPAYRLWVSGLTGGHSGEEIDRGRANACILLGRALDELRRHFPLRLASLSGGEKHNAIPTEAEALLVPESGADTETMHKLLRDFETALRREYRVTEPGLRLELSPAEGVTAVLPEADTARCLDFLLCAPNGVREMSRDFEGLVQTSLNLGILRLERERFSAEFCVRSNIATQKEALCRSLGALSGQLGGDMETEGEYPAWEYRPESPLRERLVALYREQTGAAPQVKAMHGGLECGILAAKLPGLDCISLGPDIPDIHTPRERMRISSVQRVWRLVCAFLAQG